MKKGGGERERGAKFILSGVIVYDWRFFFFSFLHPPFVLEPPFFRVLGWDGIYFGRKAALSIALGYVLVFFPVVGIIPRYFLFTFLSPGSARTLFRPVDILSAD